MPERVTQFVLLAALTAGAGALMLRWARQRWPRQENVADSRPSAPDVAFAPGTEREFADRAEKFSGLYESLYEACVARRDPDECRSVLSEWEIRLKHGGGETLRGTWREVVRGTTGLQELGAEEVSSDEGVIMLGDAWLDLLRTWGVRRDERTMFVLEEDEERRYRIGGVRRPGDPVEVELPCWTYEGEVIERGIARAVAPPS
jgi:hypothetical protein